MSSIISIICVALILICIVAEIVMLLLLIREENADGDKLFEPVGNNKNKKIKK